MCQHATVPSPMYSLDDNGSYWYLRGQIDQWRKRRKTRTEAERLEITAMIYQSHLEHCIDVLDRNELLVILFGGNPPWMMKQSNTTGHWSI